MHIQYSQNVNGTFNSKKKTNMAELHIVGEIAGAVGFEDRNLFCKVSS